PVSVAAADFNGDGRPDLALPVIINRTTLGADGEVSILLGRDDGSFDPAIQFEVGGSPNSVAVGDFNRDGRLDLAVPITRTLASGGVSILLGRGDGTFDPEASYDAGAPPGYSVAVADFNHDGRSDLALVNLDEGVSVLLGRGDGSFGPPAIVETGRSPAYLAIGDLNRDGREDLAVTVTYPDGLLVLLGRGNGTFGPPASYGAGAFGAIAVKDLDGDGRLDLALANRSGAVSILPGRGDGTFGTQASYLAGAGPSALAVGQLNGDRKPDIVVINSESDDAWVLLNQAQFPAGFASQGAFGMPRPRP
ncbi:MAG TPA: VCBS repeat-containing protein, partial [Candidatus Polarisedimenticolia bacterium]